MAYNRQANPWGGSSSELGWRGFADGSKHGNPAALAPPSSDPYTKLAIKAITDIGGAAWDEYTAPVNAGQSMWGDELKGFDTAIADQVTDETTKLRRNKNAIELAAAERAKADFIRSHPNAGKSIWNRPEWTENVPDFLMPGGSRYEVPKGAINSRQANTYRSNWKADPKFVPTYTPSQETKTVVAPVIPDNTYPNKVDINPNASVSAAGSANYTNAIEQERDASLVFQAASKEKGIDPFSNNWNEYWMPKDKLENENIRDSLRDWVSPGAMHGSFSDAETYFKNPKNKGQYAEYKKDPYAWYAKNIEPNKDFKAFSFFGN